MLNRQTPEKGRVYLIGAGPGDPDLITLRGVKIIEQVDVVVYDRLVDPELLSFTREDSEHIYVGKKCGKPSVSQEQINRIIISKALEGKSVARLKGGDPFVFGRGGEECVALLKEGVTFEIVPGVSSAIAAPAYAGVPVTYRNKARSFTVVTGHTGRGAEEIDNWKHLAEADTLVILMGLTNIGAIASRLILYGRDPDTPVTIVENATKLNQRIVNGTLMNIEEKAKILNPPATIIVGELAGMSSQLAWFNRPEENKEMNSKFAG